MKTEAQRARDARKRAKLKSKNRVAKQKIRCKLDSSSNYQIFVAELDEAFTLVIDWDYLVAMTEMDEHVVYSDLVCVLDLIPYAYPLEYDFITMRTR